VILCKKKTKINLLNIYFLFLIILKEFAFKAFNQALFFIFITKFIIYFRAINYINSCNKIGAEGAIGLGTGLHQLTKLKQLSITIRE